MFGLLSFFLLFVIAKAQPTPEAPSGNIVSAMTYYLGQEEYEVDLVAIDYVTGYFTILQNFIPAQLKGKIVICIV